MKFIELSIQIMQLLLAGMIVIFLVMQYRARGKGSEIVRRLRKHIVWETSALMVAFIFAAFTAADGYNKNPVIGILGLLFTTFLFFAFASGTKMFFEIASGKYDDQMK